MLASRWALKGRIANIFAFIIFEKIWIEFSKKYISALFKFNNNFGIQQLKYIVYPDFNLKFLNMI